MPPADRYRSLLERLFAARRFGADLSLERIRSLLEALGDPHLRIPARVAVAGTNGKGSTAAFLGAIARAANRRVGVFTSPHLLRFAERFVVDGELAGEETIAAAAEVVAAAGGDRLTFFEQCTAIAAQLFAGAGIELGIFEVGLGGRLDATAALACPLAVLTGVSYDHCDVLGDALPAIAAEKAGVIPPGGVAVVGLAGEPESPALLESAARAAGASRIIRVTAADRDAVPPNLALGGEHQRDNAAAALVAARELGVDEISIAAGLAAATIAGRLERIEAGGREVILDGAHNADGARALAAALGSTTATTAVVAVSSGRDAGSILAPLAGRVDRVIACEIAGDRASPAASVAGAAAEVMPGAVIERAADVAAALEMALVGSADRIVVFGSLYAVGEARRILRGEPADPIVLSDPIVTSGGARRP